MKMPLVRRQRDFLRTVAICLAMMWGAAAEAAIHIAGSWSTSTTNVPLESAKSQSASASIDVDLGYFIRIGVNYGLEATSSDGYQLPTSATVGAGAAANAGQKQTISCASETACVRVHNSTSIVAKGAGITIILWNGDVIMPFLVGGVVQKSYVFQTQIDGGPIDVRPGTTKPSPNVGGGVGIRLSKDFMLKFSYMASPGQVMRPGDEEPKLIWDRKSTVSLSYQI